MFFLTTRYTSALFYFVASITGKSIFENTFTGMSSFRSSRAPSASSRPRSRSRSKSRARSHSRHRNAERVHQVWNKILQWKSMKIKFKTCYLPVIKLCVERRRQQQRKTTYPGMISSCPKCCSQDGSPFVRHFKKEKNIKTFLYSVLSFVLSPLSLPLLLII